MLPLKRIARRARTLETELDAQRAVTRLRVHQLHAGIHQSLTSPTALASSVAAGIVAGHFHRHPEEEDDRKPGERKASTLRTALDYAGWALRVYLTQKTAVFLRSIA